MPPKSLEGSKSPSRDKSGTKSPSGTRSPSKKSKSQSKAKSHGDSQHLKSGTYSDPYGSSCPTHIETERTPSSQRPPSRDPTAVSGIAAHEEREGGRGGVDFSLFPYVLLGFVLGLIVGVIVVVLLGCFICILTDVRQYWRDVKKRAFLAGFLTGFLIAAIVWIALFIALVVND